MGRRPNDIKIRLIGECLDAGLSTREAADLLGASLATARIYAWAYRHPKGYSAWRERERVNAKARYEKTGRRPRSTFWNEERLAALKEMRAANRTFSQCAEELGHGCTRSMIAGAVNRRGLSQIKYLGSGA